MSEDLTILPLKTDKSSIKLKTPINEVLMDLENNFVLLIFSPRGGGKCLGYDTPIKMYDGSIKKVQNIKVNDLIMGDDDTPRKILKLGRGIEQMYLIKQDKGINYRCNETHILSLIDDKNNKYDLEIKDYKNFNTKLYGYKIINKKIIKYNIKIIKDKIDNYFGFTIDGNKRFKLGDDTITHNTTLYSNLLLNPNFFKRENYQYAFIISSTIYQDLSAKALRDNFGETLYDRYDDSIIDNLIKFQRSFKREDRPKTILVLDDICGKNIRACEYGITRFRHDNISCIISTQQSKSVRKVARLNATDVIVGATKNWKEIEDIYTEYGMLFGSLEKWIKIFRYATKEPYHFLYMKIDKKPYRCFKNFTEDITNKFSETSNKKLFMGETMENKLNEDVDKVNNYKDELNNNY